MKDGYNGVMLCYLSVRAPVSGTIKVRDVETNFCRTIRYRGLSETKYVINRLETKWTSGNGAQRQVHDSRSRNAITA